LQQSHHCGIETIGDGNLLGSCLGCSNRTIVGLKQLYSCPNPNLSCCSNRTIVGLKLQAFLANADIKDYRSNRTIVGLKLVESSAKFVNVVWQQSHHCGIETITFNREGDAVWFAAIAPLWD